MTDYSARKLTFVNVWGLERLTFADGEHGVAGAVRFQVNSSDGSEHGPHITIEIAAKCAENPDIETAEKTIISAALGLLSRLSREPIENAVVKLLETRSAAITKKDGNA